MEKTTIQSLPARLWQSTPAIWGLALIPYLIAVCNCMSNFTNPSKHPGNLHTFRDAAIAMAHGSNLYQSGNRDYVYPPLIAFLYQPLGWISLMQAAAVMLGVNVILGILTLKIICREMLLRFTGRASSLMIAQTALLAAWLSVDHIHTEFNQWETNIFVLLAFVLALRWADRRPLLAGAVLGIGFNIKYLPAILIPYLILRRRWSMLLAFLASIIFFSLLPAVSMGWDANLRALNEAYAGITKLIGISPAAQHSARTQPFTSFKSISMPSAIGRITQFTELHTMFVAGVFAIILLLLWAFFYHAHALKIFRWETIQRQHGQTSRALFGLEWIALMLVALIFSPYTNSAHLYLLIAVNAGAAVLLLFAAPGLNRWPLLIGALIMCLGMILPPGGKQFQYANVAANFIGVPAWCMYLMAIVLIWTGVQHIRRIAGPPSSQSGENSDRNTDRQVKSSSPA